MSRTVEAAENPRTGTILSPEETLDRLVRMALHGLPRAGGVVDYQDYPLLNSDAYYCLARARGENGELKWANYDSLLDESNKEEAEEMAAKLTSDQSRRIKLPTVESYLIPSGITLAAAILSGVAMAGLDTLHGVSSHGIQNPDQNSNPLNNLNLDMTVGRVFDKLNPDLALAQNEACVNPTNYSYSPVLCFRDSLGRQRFWGVENVGPTGRVDDYIDRVYTISFYLDRANYLSGRAGIDSLVFNQSKDVIYMSVIREIVGGSYQLDSAEVVTDPNDPGNLSKRFKLTSTGISNIATDGNYSPLSLVTEGSSQSLIRDASNALTSSQRGRYRLILENDGIHTRGDWVMMVVPTLTATPSPTLLVPSPTVAVVRASRFEIQPVPSITWQDGSMEDDYVPLRIGASSVKLAPGVNPLPKDSTSYTDPSPSPSEPCYLIVARRAGAVIANSDLMCMLSGIQSPNNVPEGFSVGLMGQTANIRLRRTAGFDAYAIIALGFAGQRVLPFPGDRITDTITDPACYVAAGSRAGVITLTNGLCVFPGLANGIN